MNEIEINNTFPCSMSHMYKTHFGKVTGTGCIFPPSDAGFIPQ